MWHCITQNSFAINWLQKGSSILLHVQVPEQPFLRASLIILSANAARKGTSSLISQTVSKSSSCLNQGSFHYKTQTYRITKNNLRQEVPSASL